VVVDSRMYSSAEPARLHNEVQLHALAGSAEAAVQVAALPDKAGGDAGTPARKSQTSGLAATVGAGAVRCPPVFADRSEGEGTRGSLVQQCVLSGERESGNLTWEETDRTAVQTFQD